MTFDDITPGMMCTYDSFFMKNMTGFVIAKDGSDIFIKGDIGDSLTIKKDTFDNTCKGFNVRFEAGQLSPEIQQMIAIVGQHIK
jgi:hypothetical protein